MKRFNNIGRIKVFLKDPNKKSWFKICKELFVLAWVKREIPFYYFKFIYRKSVVNYLDYHSFGDMQALNTSSVLHNRDLNAIIENKLFFAFYAEKANIKTPKLITYNTKSHFFWNGTLKDIQTKAEAKMFFQHVLDENGLDGLFFRPPSEYGGKGCFKMTRADLDEKLDAYFDVLIKGTFVHTQLIVQHDAINKIHGNSVNTLRIITIITKDKHTEFIGGFYRFGVGASVVDNATSGGFTVGVNMETGTLKAKGHYLMEFGGATVTQHPDSGFVFDGFKIPFYADILKMLEHALKVFPDRLIGWDIAITQEGPVIVECNSYPHIPLSDMAYGGMLKNKHMRSLLEEVKAQR